MKQSKNGFIGSNLSIAMASCLLLILIVSIIVVSVKGTEQNKSKDDLFQQLNEGNQQQTATELEVFGPPAPQQDQESDTPTPSVSEEDLYPGPEVELVEYTGRVEHIFFHPLVAYPELAFDGDYMSDGFDDWFVTVSEYNKMLQSMYEKGFILVDINSLYGVEVIDGVEKMVAKDIYLPAGKKPLVISYDDVNYYEYMRENGVVYKLILDENGNIASYGKDPQGNEVIAYDLDVVTILDAFVKEHPDFSFKGAKGVLGLTGFEGILGYRTHRDSPNRESEIEAVKPVIERLKETGWTFASHSYSHLNMTNASYDEIVADTDKWVNEVQSLIGDTQVLLYPYGARVDENNGASFQYLQQKGFRIFCSVGYESYVNVRSDTLAVCTDRRHPDGTTLRWNRSQYLDLYDAQEVMDLASRPNREYDFSR